MSRRWLAPEVIQSSGTDCGPAALKSMFDGFGLHLSYGRLREACQTDVDGTSIDALEEVGVRLGLDVEQVMAPPDLLPLPDAALLPAVAVVRLPNGFTHFVVVWRRHGPWLQIMDPAIGRRWLHQKRFLPELYRHRQAIAAEDWRQWAESDAFREPLTRRLEAIGASREAAESSVDAAMAVPGWKAPAALDASVRMTATLVDAGGVRSGSEAAELVAELYRRSLDEPDDEEPVSVADEYWFVRPSPEEGEAEQVEVRGAVLLCATDLIDAEERPDVAELPEELAAAVTEAPARPGRELLRLLRKDGVLYPAGFCAGLLLAGSAVLVEALLFRGILDIGHAFGGADQRLAAILGLALFVAAQLALEVPLNNGLWRLGRRLEMRLRIAFQAKIPRLGDRYFRSRLCSDMAERGHALHHIRRLPMLGGRIVSTAWQLVLTTAGILWLDPKSAPLALAAALCSLLLGPLAHPILAERDLRVRNHGAALSRFYLDGLLGLNAVRSHSADGALRREHEGLLAEWGRSSLSLLRAATLAQGFQLAIGLGLGAWLVVSHLSRGGEAGAVLLLVYWALNLPVLGDNLALLARQYPALRSVTLRLLEPLEAREEERVLVATAEAESGESSRAATRPASPKVGTGVSIRFEGVGAGAGGHTILDGVDLALAAGDHLAVVGPSGAGKSSLMGLLLGWLRPNRGRIVVDGVELDAAGLAGLRSWTAWVDPEVQLWNRSLFDNLRYGAGESGPVDLTRAVAEADLLSVLQRLPEGLQTSLGEGGGLLSGGEGQRVRLARAMLRSPVRLALLDEPFRGLDRGQRRVLLDRSRKLWRHSTILCATHDVSATVGFPRVAVVEGGTVVETGSPERLAGESGSRYRALLEADRSLTESVWSETSWRRVELRDGRLREAVAVRRAEEPAA